MKRIVPKLPMRSGKFDRQFNIGSGLINQYKRNNCFFNATLQAVFHIPKITSYLERDLERSCAIRECVTCMFLNLFKNTQCSKVPCSPYQFYDALQKTNTRFSGLLNGKHQDSHEFLVLLTEELERQPHSTLWFASNFTSNIETHINCSSCGTIHRSSIEVLDFALHLQGNQSIQNALDSYFNYEDTEYLCDSCRVYDVAKKQHFLLSAPNCLCVQLRRFSDRGEKLNDKIEISSELSLAKYFLKTQAATSKYRLVAIVNHFGGSRYVGHYNTIVLKSNDVCYEFDDRSVRQVSSNLISGENAYLLFYEQIKDQPQIVENTLTLNTEISSIDECIPITLSSNNELCTNARNNSTTPLLVEGFVAEITDGETNRTKNPTENNESSVEGDVINETSELDESGIQHRLQCPKKHIPIVTGRRLFDVDYLFNQMKQLTDFHCSECKHGKITFCNETRRGLKSIFIFGCNECPKTIRFNSSLINDDNEDINLSSVLAITAVGLGYYHLQEFLAHLNIPAMSYVTYHKLEEDLQFHYLKLAKKLEAEALEEEIKLSKDRNEVDSAGNALIPVEFDGSWEKRAYTNNFTSLAGCAAIIGLRTKKILYSAVKTKYCHICKIAESQNRAPKEHKCNRNYEGPSSGMETQIIIDGFKHCAEKGARFNKYVGDGDSSTYKALRDLQLYKDPPISIEKFECVNHLFRNFFKQFKALLKSSKISIKGRKLLTLEIGRNICKGIRSAAKHWRESSVDMVDKYSNLERDIMNAFEHCLGIHDSCAKYFCKKETDPEALNKLEILKETGIYYEMLDLCQSYFGSNVKSLIAGFCTNKTEGFNSLIAKSLAGKRICNSMDGSYKLRTTIANVQYNTEGHSGTKIQQFIFGESIPICGKMENARKRKCSKNAIAKKNKPKNYTPEEPSSKKKKKKHYGDGHEDADMTESAFELAKIRHFKRLGENQMDREILQVETRAQHNSFKWTEVRRLLVTSSYFGRILNVRNRQSYTKIVEEILYKNSRYTNTAESRHQRIYEFDALLIFTTHYPYDSISKCGIFIDAEMSFLGASPFRLCGEDGIVVIKCPKNEFGKSVENAIKTISFWTGTITNRSINYKSHWYFEIQGQLHITKKQMAYLVIYLGSNVCEIVEIQKNDEFWKKHMEKELVYFYNEALLKELVDPREERGMDLRTYNSNKQVFE